MEQQTIASAPRTETDEEIKARLMRSARELALRIELFDDARGRTLLTEVWYPAAESARDGAKRLPSPSLSRSSAAANRQRCTLSICAASEWRLSEPNPLRALEPQEPKWHNSQSAASAWVSTSAAVIEQRSRATDLAISRKDHRAPGSRWNRCRASPWLFSSIPYET